MTLIEQEQPQGNVTVDVPTSWPEASGLLVAYAANPLFAAATAEELRVPDNPYRRPVRPDDLDFIDYSTPVVEANASELSALIAGRLLLNVNDAATLVLPAEPDAAAWADFGAFYDEESRILGERVRPFLENHLFADVRERAEREHAVSTDGLRDRLLSLVSERQQASAAVASLIRSSGTPQLCARTTAVQHVARALGGSGPTAAAVGGAGGDGLGNPALAEGVSRLAEVAELIARPHSHYQFYLPSTLTLMAHLSGVRARAGSYLRRAGVEIVDRIDAVARAGEAATAVHAVMTEDSANTAQAGSAADVVERWLDVVLASLIGTHGPAVVHDVARGVEEHALLLGRHDRDLTTQLAWLDSLDHYRDKARRLQAAIAREQIPVDLDTFDESWEECSTTHVHDEDRLLEIATGEMDFWNCIGREIHFSVGDVMFIPKHRLHGSVVRTGRCLYHQPVITDELNRRFG